MRAIVIASALTALGLSGCAVYHVASTAVDVTTTVVATTVDVVGAVVSAPFGHDAKAKKTRDD